MSSAAAPAVRGPGGHRGTEQGRPGAAGTGPLPSSTRVNSGVAGARCPAQGRRGLEGSRRVYERPAAHKGVAAAHRLELYYYINQNIYPTKSIGERNSYI